MERKIMGYSDLKKDILQTFLKPWIVLFLDVIVSVFASGIVLVLVNILIPQLDFGRNQMMAWLMASLLLSIFIFRIGRVYQSVIRYSTLRELGRLCVLCFGKDVMLWICMIAFGFMGAGSGLLLGMVVVDFFVTMCALALVRVVMLVAYDIERNRNKNIEDAKDRNVRKVVVYGTSDKSVAVISRLRNSDQFRIMGIVAYGDPSISRLLAGHKVFYYEDMADLKRYVDTLGAKGILFPYVGDARVEKDRLLAHCKEIDLKTYIVPYIDEITDGDSVNYIRKIKIEDLLGRDEIKISMNEIVGNFIGKVVLVTGAAGSIGSELCRQLASFGIRQLLLFDNAETPLHNIRLELEDKFPHLDFVPIIGDVRSKDRLEFVFRKYKPQVVFHAAAYKHVPLMEENPCEAVMVNVGGSRNVADKCVEYDVEKMVMISTDKAVNPTNIMGCTKRLAEIYCQSLGLAIERGEIKGRTTFVTTRFGNVLGSNGSVIPRFREQIERGGPVTVTHPEITRFFMTIPEACRLVMEAATFATGTQIFVFDMGESVKIVTLAERMISLAGLQLGQDIKIEFTGLRPGEKLYEEVLATKENTLPTSHERIFVAKAREYAYRDAMRVAGELLRYSESVTIPDMVILMKRTVPEFKSRNSEFEKYDINE